MVSLCLKCGHDINKHQISIIGNYEAVEVNCTEQPYENDYGER